MELLKQLQMNWVEWFGVVTGLLFLYLEIKQRLGMWIVGLVSSSAYVILFFHEKLYADTLINLYYALMSIYGMTMWMKKNTDAHDNPTIRNVSYKVIILLFPIGLLIFAGISFWLSRYTDSPLPYHDAFLSTLSILATWMLSRKYIQQWFLWILANGFSVYLFLIKGLYPTMFLFVIYTLLSGYGYYSWKYRPRTKIQEEN